MATYMRGMLFFILHPHHKLRSYEVRTDEMLLFIHCSIRLERQAVALPEWYRKSYLTRSKCALEKNI